MPSLCQAEWETSSQERENECQMVEEKKASDMGDGGGEEKAEGETDQEGDTKDEGGLWGGAASPSLPTPIESHSTPEGPEEVEVWAPQEYAAQIAFLATLVMLRANHFKRRKISATEGEVIDPFWTHYMLQELKQNFEQSPDQKQKIAKDKKQKMKCERRLCRRKGRFLAMLNEKCGIPKGNPSGPPPTKNNTSPNKGGEKIAKFVLATGRYDLDSLKAYIKCLGEGAKRRRWEDEDCGWSGKRKKGDCQSNGTDKVAVARKKRAQQRVATNLFFRWRFEGWQRGARGTESLYSSDGTLLPLSHFKGRCTGEVHGDRICGRQEELQKCELCFQLEDVERWLCSMCRHTEASVCRNCPAKQRAEGGRQPRADEPRCDPQEYNNKRWKMAIVIDYQGNLQ